MRGRTLDDSFIILDEAQNTSPEQMKMFLTRLGNGAKAVVTGDPSQTDLPRDIKSGLAVAASILKDIKACRKAKKMTQSELAQITGISQPNITRFESGNYNPSLEMMVRIAYALDMKLDIKLVDEE